VLRYTHCGALCTHCAAARIVQYIVQLQKYCAPAHIALRCCVQPHSINRRAELRALKLKQLEFQAIIKKKKKKKKKKKARSRARNGRQESGMK
jgi:hypothetical protein